VVENESRNLSYKNSSSHNRIPILKQNNRQIRSGQKIVGDSDSLKVFYFSQNHTSIYLLVPKSCKCSHSFSTSSWVV